MCSEYQHACLPLSIGDDRCVRGLGSPPQRTGSVDRRCTMAFEVDRRGFIQKWWRWRCAQPHGHTLRPGKRQHHDAPRLVRRSDSRRLSLSDQGIETSAAVLCRVPAKGGTMRLSSPQLGFLWFIVILLVGISLLLGAHLLADQRPKGDGVGVVLAFLAPIIILGAVAFLMSSSRGTRGPGPGGKRPPGQGRPQGPKG